jgi:hypothetical protein
MWLALGRGVTLRPLARSAVLLVPLLVVCGARLHAQRSATPERLPQELNRCLTLIRVAAARRRPSDDVASRLALAVRSDGGPSWLPRRRPRVQG